MGRAGMPYARSVQQMHPLPLNRLPDAGLVFDTLLRRQKVRFILHRVLKRTPAHHIIPSF
jgi:hypothetical protein